MCLEENNVKPKTNTHYKVFAEEDGKLYWLMRNLTGGISLASDKIENDKILTSTEKGFHVWENKSDAENFKYMIENSFKFNKNLVIKEVICKSYIKSGLCTSSVRGIENIEKPNDIMNKVLNDDSLIKSQAFAYRNMEIIK